MKFDLQEILTNKETYEKVFHSLYDSVVEDYDFKYKEVKLKLGKETLTMKVSDFLMNVVLWKPFLYFEKPFEKEFILNTNNLNADTISSYLDKVVEKFLDDGNQRDLNLCLSEIIEELGWFSLDFNMIIGNTINLYDKIKLAERNPRYNEILHTKFDSHMSTDQIEKEMISRTQELMEIYATEDNNFKDYVNAKEGINKDQLTQFEINVGPKPDLQGNVFPKIVNTNFLVDGLQSASDYFIDSSGGRKASIINFAQVKKAGYTTRKLTLLCMNTILDYKVKDCKSVNTTDITIDSEKSLNRFNGRYYRLDGEEHVIDISKDQDLIGKKIQLHSPISCSSTSGICRKCYGNLSKINNDIHVGILGTNYLTEQLTQMLLSAKHLLKTNSEVIKLTDEFNEIFSLDANTVSINPSLDNENKYTLRIDEADIHENEDLSEDIREDLDFSKNIRSLTVIYKEKKNSVREFVVDIEKDLYLSPHFLKRLRDKAVKDDNGIFELSLKDLDLNEPVFFIEVENNELSTHLQNILKLIDNKERLHVNSKEEMLEKFLELLNESNIRIDSVHIENIIRELIRRPDDQTLRPDFTQKDPEYDMLRVSDAIMKSPSIVTSISFEKIKKQLFEPETYEKTAPSLFDMMFK